MITVTNTKTPQNTLFFIPRIRFQNDSDPHVLDHYHRQLRDQLDLLQPQVHRHRQPEAPGVANSTQSVDFVNTHISTLSDI